MANEFVKKEVSKIFAQKGDDEAKKVAMATAWIVANYKGVNIKIFDARETSSLCDYNIIATAQNVTQAKTMIDELQANLRENGSQIISVEGLTDGAWMLLDAGDVIVHIFQEIPRQIFDLDELWSAFPQVEIPQEYYFEHQEMDEQKEDKKSDPTDNYF